MYKHIARKAMQSYPIDTPKVSVIMPVYNGEKTLSKCLDSVLNQSYGNYEVIAVDNDSTDKTKDIIETYGGVKYIFEKHRSRGAARNAGIEAASGEIIAMTDSDCVVPRNWLRELTKPIIFENESVVSGFEEDLVRNYWTENIQKASWEFVKRNLNGRHLHFLDTKNFAIKTLLMRELMFDPNIGYMEDFDFYLRLRKISKVRFIPSLKVGHNHRTSFIGVVVTNFDRAYWVIKIYRKYKPCKLNHPMMESISVKNYILFPFWMIYQFIKMPVGNAYFLLVSEVSWRAGMLWALVVSNFL